jgi:MFS family permease
MTILFASLTAGSAVYANDNTDHAAAKAVVALIFLYYTFYNIMMPLTYIYITELFPFINRSKGVAITQFFSRGGNAFNLFVNPIGLLSLQWKYYLVFVAWLAIETLVIFFVYPETKGPSLEEIAMIVEGPGAKVEVITADGQDRKDLLAVQQVEKI